LRAWENKSLVATIQKFLDPGIILYDCNNVDQESQIFLQGMIHYSNSRNICKEKTDQILCAKILIEELFKVTDICKLPLSPKIRACLNHAIYSMGYYTSFKNYF